MKKIIIIQIRYQHDDTCKYLETHDNQDCDCGAQQAEGEDITAEEIKKPE